jgi:hypothetical protein
VLSHPKRQQITEELLRGGSILKVSKKYGIGYDSLKRYKNDWLIKKAAQLQRAADTRDADLLWDLLEETIDEIQQMRRACQRYLADPDREGEFDVGPRDHDVEVIYYDPDTRSSHKALLSTLLATAAATQQVKITSAHWRHADPRKLILETHRTLAQQLELLARIQGQIKDETNVYLSSPVVQQVQQVLLVALEKYPEARRDVVSALAAIGAEEEAARESGQ